MKILSISDVITNSSSEVFIIDKKDSNVIPKDLLEYSTEVNEDNFIDLILNGDTYGNIYDVVNILGLPSIFYWVDTEELSKLLEYHSKKEVVTFFKPLLNDILDKIIISFTDEDSFGYNCIKKLIEALDKNNVKYIKERC